MADSRQRAESTTLQVGPCACACCILSLRRRVVFFVIDDVTCSCLLALLFSIRAASHATRTCPFSLPDCRSLLSWSLNCDALLEIIHIIRGKSFVCYQVVLCVFSQVQIGRGRVFIECTQKVLKILLLGTPKKYFFVRVKCDFTFFPGEFFVCITNKTGRRVGQWK